MRRDEVVIVGGGPAGLSTALFLQSARPDLTERIVVLEKERYPRDKPCAGAVGARAEKALARIGVRADVEGATFDRVEVRFATGVTEVRERGMGRVIRRIDFDHALAREARARGIRVVDGARVTSLARTADGVVATTTAGDFEARALVGADGVGSFVRRWMGLPTGSLRAQVVEVDTEEVAGDPPRDTIVFDLSDRAYAGYAWDFPTRAGGAWVVCRGVYRVRVGDDAIDVQATLDARLAALGLDPRAYPVKRYAERGFEPHRAASAPHVLLAGESAGIDPITGEGIAQAILYGEVAARYLARRLRDGRLDFADWAAALRTTRLGLDLHVRTAMLPFVFGAPRARTERWVLASPAMLRAGAAHFAGEPVRWGALAVAAAGALREATRGAAP